MALSASSMAGRIQAAVDAIAGQQTTDAAGMAGYRMNLYTAMSQGIIEEIVANSELVPVSTDSGAAGAGIITGKVK
jgi:hypothetical protein